MATKAQDEFLLTVRHSLGLPGRTPPVDRERLSGPISGAEKASILRAKLESRSDEQLGPLLEDLERELTQVGGRVTRIGSRQTLEKHLEELVSSRGIEKVVRWKTPLLEEVEQALVKDGATVTTIGAAPEDPKARAEVNQAIIDADLGITEVDYAIADTGTLVLFTGEDRSRLVSLLPPLHIALLRPSVIVPSMAELLPVLSAYAREDPRSLGSCITFITGPSRTADIEKVLTIGVHGPKELHLLILHQHNNLRKEAKCH